MPLSASRPTLSADLVEFRRGGIARVLESVIQVLRKKLSRIERSFFVSKIEIFDSFTKGNRRDDRDLDIRIDRVPGLKFIWISQSALNAFVRRNKGFNLSLMDVLLY